jgi:hypothetical protein
MFITRLFFFAFGVSFFLGAMVFGKETHPLTKARPVREKTTQKGTERYRQFAVPPKFLELIGAIRHGSSEIPQFGGSGLSDTAERPAIYIESDNVLIVQISSPIYPSMVEKVAAAWKAYNAKAGKSKKR